MDLFFCTLACVVIYLLHIHKKGTRMQKFSLYSVALVLSFACSSSLYSSTVWSFNETTISGHIEDEIDKHIKPGKQDEAMKVELQDFKQRRKKAYVNAVAERHYNRPFRTEQEAKSYASEVARGASSEFFDDILKKRIAMKVARLPKEVASLKEELTLAAKNYVENKAYQESLRTGCINETLKTVDALIIEGLRAKYKWTCTLCSWLHNQ